MSKPDVQHYLDIYQNRLEMLREGLINPSQEAISVMETIVDKLSQLPPTEPIFVKNNRMTDARGNIIVSFPDEQFS